MLTREFDSVRRRRKRIGRMIIALGLNLLIVVAALAIVNVGL